MKREIILLILHILLVMFFAADVIVADTLLLKTLYVICTILWSIVVGMDISKMILGK